MPRLLLIGWDAADWKVIQPLIEAGLMPNLARLIEQGVSGNLATIYPILSPMLWTSIATGKRPYKHGILGFSEPLPDGSGVRPISLVSRKTKAVWNILNQNGYRSLVAGWWPSHPAEPINGVMVSNHFQRAAGPPGALPPMPPGTIYPPSLAPSLAELRVSPMELQGEFVRLFVPEYEKVDQTKDKRLHSLGRIVAETMSLHAAATELLATQPWDFAAIYYDAVDHFGHAFMRYHPPRLPSVSEADFAIYQHVISNAYRYHDAMLGTLLGFADTNTTVILMSDHGFHPDHLRPAYIPAEPAGPAIEHRHFGIFCARGPGLRVNEEIFGASILDVCPTILTLFGLPPGKDMDGKVLLNAFKEPPAVQPIESWDTMPGDAGTLPAETRIDPAASAEAFKQLAELGYVAPPGATVQETIDECARELKYNLARAYRDANRCGEAASLAEQLWTRWPREHRFGILLLDCLGPLQEFERRREVIEELSKRIERYQAEARTELERLEAAGKKENKTPRERYEERHLRELAHGRPLLIEWFRVTQALLEKRPEEARRCLEPIVEADGAIAALNQRLAAAMADLGEMEPAHELLEAALKEDPENALVHAQLAGLHFKAGRFEEAIASATESLSLLYFQPAIHGLLGNALMKTNRFTEAEQELRVAVSQSPRNLAAHELLAQLYRQHLDRPADAFAHEGKSLTLRQELARRQRAPVVPSEKAAAVTSNSSQTTAEHTNSLAPPFGPDVDRGKIITVVSGLPRSGTSMMMQLLVAAGREALTDNKRIADEDNVLGYFEFDKAQELAKDVSWVPQARGKVVKIVAQLLHYLPPDEHYEVIFMERGLEEVISSQKAMLARHGRHGADLNDQTLRETYATQLQRIRAHLGRRPNIRTLFVDYGELLTEPGSSVTRLAAFLGEPFDHEAACGAIRPELRRQREAEQAKL